MSKISWVYGILQNNGVDTTDMEPREAFAELAKLRKSGKVSDDQIKFSKSHSDAPSKTGNTRKTNASAEDKISIKGQVNSALPKLAKTKSVAIVPKGAMTTDFKTAITALEVKLSKNRGIVSRKGFGEVQVSARLKQAAKYIKSSAEVAAFATAPAVIRNGIAIGEHKDHKGRGYPSTTFAGRVKIGDKEGIVAVTVIKTTDNFYKIHRVLTPDGKDFEIEKPPSN